MNAPLQLLVLCSAAVLVIVTVSGAAGSTGSNPDSADIRIEMKAGSLTLETRDAPLYEVMRRIGELAGFKTILVADFIKPKLVSVSFDNIPVREAVERLLGNTNRAIFYAPAGIGAQDHVISQVWLLGSSGASGDDEAGDGESIGLAENLHHEEGKIRSEAVLRLSNQAVLGLSNNDATGHVLAKLTQVLQEDQEALVRSRAAIALGALRDERAVLALESALLDEHSSVRSQAINALGQIGGERATMALGNILLNGSADKTERVMAAQALWKHDSEAARDYLRTGANDTDEQVRLASSKAPALPKIRVTTDQLGPAKTQ
jgi:hypothetical protein